MFEIFEFKGTPFIPDVKIYPMWFVLFPLLLSFGAGVSFGDDILSCEPTLDPRAPRPAVCGKCEIRVEDGRLVIQEAKGCPRYEVYRCRKRDGTTFLINTLRCKSLEDRRR